MSRPRWSAAAFARLVQISGDAFWVVVEGRDHDRSHYGRLLENLPSTKGHSVVIRLAEEIEVNQRAAGGKSHALALHKHLADANELVQSSSAGKARVVFMLDRDRDDYLGLMSASPHVIYSYATDVEADILLNSDIWSALQAAYGIDSGLTSAIRSAVPHPASKLAMLWEDWLRLGLIALACNAQHCAPWAQPSTVNSPVYGPVDPANILKVDAALAAAARQAHPAEVHRANVHVASRGERLLKGRWLSKYLQVLVSSHLSHEVIKANVRADSVIEAALSGLKYDGSWARRYESRLSTLVRTT